MSRMRTMSKSEPKGLGIATSYGTATIEVPEITSESHRLSVIAELYALCESPPTEPRWVIDLSNLSVLPVSLASIFVALGNDLRKQGREVRFDGLNPEALTPDIRRTLTQSFPEVFGPSFSEH